MKPIVMLALFNAGLWAGPTTVLFQPDSPNVGPFPANALTVPDATQKTGLRVQLPASSDHCDPSASPGVCGNLSLVNQLDGFSVNPRLMVCFSADVDPGTLRAGIGIVNVGSGSTVAINQVIYDPKSKCAFAKPNRVLNQQSRYLLIVTDAVQDSTGKSVQKDKAFQGCRQGGGAYCTALSDALDNAEEDDSGDEIVAASLFTTMSATTWLEQARTFVEASEPPVVLPAGLPSTFSVANLRSITWVPQDNTGTTANQQDLPLSALSGVGQISFGLYLSPNFLNPATGSINPAPTKAPLAAPTPIPGVVCGGMAPPCGYLPVSFHVFLPASPAPTNGFPVVIYGHGLGDSQFGAPTYIASTLAQNGFATLAIEITGHGFGPGSIVKLTDTTGHVYTVATPGRGIQLPGNTKIGPTDGCIVPGALAVRDCGRQTAVDLMALVSTIQKTSGLGAKLDPKRIYYVGQSFGSTYGTLFHAVEPNVRVATLNAAGGTSIDVARLAITGRPLGIAYLAPFGLLNVPPAPSEAYFHDFFNDNYVFRGQPPVTNKVPGAMAIQAAFESADWLGMVGDPLSFAPHLKNSPLAGVPEKSTLFRFGYGDLEVPNPTESAVIHAAGAKSTSWFFRFDIAAIVDMHPELLFVTMPAVAPLPILPHRILSNPTIFDVPAEKSLALAEQQQIALYFESRGDSNPDPNPLVKPPFLPVSRVFEVPATLPQALNFIQVSP